MIHCKNILLSTLLLSCALTSACGGSGGVPSNNLPPVPTPEPEPNPTTDIPTNNISYATIRDTNGERGLLSVTAVINAPSPSPTDSTRASSLTVYWADNAGNPIGEPWNEPNSVAGYQLATLIDSTIPEGATAVLVHPTNSAGMSIEGQLIAFHDFTGNTHLAGPGGNEQMHWYYGDTRPHIQIERSALQNGLCIFDNGLVSVTDMDNSKDTAWETKTTTGSPNTVSEAAFPAYSFVCDANPINTYRDITDDIGTWTYSTLNDAMFYGTMVYDTFLKYLGEPPLEDKIRLRVHYGNEIDIKAFWDGAYASFSDGYATHYSLATLDLIAHEIGHGVLGRISPLKVFGTELSQDARTLHEAFGDISGVMAKYEWTSSEDNWVHGEESAGNVRTLDHIVTEYGAIPSALDYAEAGDNYYKRIGMITYPFYLLSQNWGLEETYRVYISAARQCWLPNTTLTLAAECVQQQAASAGWPASDVSDAFKTVKIQLFEEGVLSHYIATLESLTAAFTDDSRSTSQVTQWLWDFGDGNQSTQENPTHTYTQAGNYNVTLTVTDQSGDTDIFGRDIYVTGQTE